MASPSDGGDDGINRWFGSGSLAYMLQGVTISTRKARLLACAVTRQLLYRTAGVYVAYPFFDKDQWDYMVDALACGERLAETTLESSNLPGFIVTDGVEDNRHLDAANALLVAMTDPAPRGYVGRWPDVDQVVDGLFQRKLARDMVVHVNPFSLLDHRVLSSTAGPGVYAGDTEDEMPVLNGKKARNIVTGRDRWVTPAVLAIARAAYEDRDEAGVLAGDGLAVLADALEEEGCDVTLLLDHLRGVDPCPMCFVIDGVMPGCGRCDGTGKVKRTITRYRGTWSLDLVLNLE